MFDKYGTGEDPYTYKNTDVLINKFGIDDSALLEKAEQEFTQLAAAEIQLQPAPYNFAYYCELHYLLFNQLYGWAGEIRTIDISKGNTRFCSVDYIEREASRLFGKLEGEQFLVSLEYTHLITKLAEFYCEINVLHPFRDGNGRAQRLLFEHIAMNCGYNLRLTNITEQEWVYANILGYNGDYSAMELIFSKCIETVG